MLFAQHGAGVAQGGGLGCFSQGLVKYLHGCGSGTGLREQVCFQAIQLLAPQRVLQALLVEPGQAALLLPGRNKDMTNTAVSGEVFPAVCDLHVVVNRSLWLAFILCYAPQVIMRLVYPLFQGQ